MLSETSSQVSSKHLRSSLQKKPCVPPVRPFQFSATTLITSALAIVAIAK